MAAFCKKQPLHRQSRHYRVSQPQNTGILILTVLPEVPSDLHDSRDHQEAGLQRLPLSITYSEIENSLGICSLFPRLGIKP